MRKYANVDVPATLGAVMEVNTEHYKSDFEYDLTMFREAARNPDGENNCLLWLSRKNGTECFYEREAYLVESYAHSSWVYHAKSHSETPLAYAVHIKGIEDGRIKGDIIELDYQAQAKVVERDALHVAAVTAVYADGAELHLPYAEWDGQRARLSHEHGKLQTLRREPKSEAALTRTLKAARDSRSKEARPAAFKLRVAAQRRPSIKQQLADGKLQIEKNRAAAPERVAAAAKPRQMEVER
jgi:hypothetical protein